MDRIQLPYKERSLSDDLVSPNCSVTIPEGFKALILRFMAFWDTKTCSGYFNISRLFGRKRHIQTLSIITINTLHSLSPQVVLPSA